MLISTKPVRYSSLSAFSGSLIPSEVTNEFFFAISSS
jgi:hypothetical protein